HRTPIDPGRFHRHLRHTLGGQPRPQLAQRRRPGSELPHLLHPPPATRADLADAGHHRVLVHIERRAAIDDHSMPTHLLVTDEMAAPGASSVTRIWDTRSKHNPRCLEAPAPV